MKFGIIIEKYEEDKEVVMDTLEMGLPDAGIDYYEDPEENKIAKEKVTEINKAIALQKKDVSMWKKKRGDNKDNVEAAEGILADLETKKRAWEKAQEPPPEPEPEPEDGEDGEGGEGPPQEEPEPYPGTERDGQNEPKDGEEEPEEDRERKGKTIYG